MSLLADGRRAPVSRVTLRGEHSHQGRGRRVAGWCSHCVTGCKPALMCHGLPHSDRMWLCTNRSRKTKGIALLIHSPHELRVHGDRDLLIDAVANLVDNAAKFTPEIDWILRETITDPVGPEFMAPPSLSSEA